MSNPDVHTGGCLCGAVRYRVTGPLREVALCHCGQCRKFHGHVGAYTNVARDKLELTADGGLAWYMSSTIAKRGFCRMCGSSLFWERLGADTISIAAGTLDGPTGLKTTRQIFAAPEHRGDYYELDTHLETFPGTMG
ncbi:MAG: GFA family protein [Alphaproteobacteria bacterium]